MPGADRPVTSTWSSASWTAASSTPVEPFSIRSMRLSPATRAVAAVDGDDIADSWDPDPLIGGGSCVVQLVLGALDRFASGVELDDGTVIVPAVDLRRAAAKQGLASHHQSNPINGC